MTTFQQSILPDYINPIRYILKFSPNLENFTFSGNETIELNISKSFNEITLHSSEIDIIDVDLSGKNPSIASDIESETVTFQFDTEIPAGNYSLNINFCGTLNDRLRGFYRSRYLDTNGTEKFMATTQFEATDARKAFPCWDEPESKSIFSVSITLPEELTAISNMPEDQILDLGNGLKNVTFADTPIMSTYLLGFTIAEMECVQRKTKHGTLMRVWTTKGKENQGNWALESSIQLLDFFNDYFGIPYPLPKLDHLAIPDFAAGAMENWGIITYREVVLLMDEDNTAATTKQFIVEVIAHEMAHQWFGNLVTMKWWNDLWLNESFASWMGDKATDWLHPEWDMWTQFLTHDTNRGLSLDGLANSHPIEQDVKNPAEIGQLFDAISYSKGASILRMLEQFLGEETFKSGLRNYLKEHAYANATTHDLWKSLEEASGLPVNQIMESWTTQTGFPVLKVKTEKQHDSLSINFEQNQFRYDNILNESTQNDSLWQIPISVSSSATDSTIRELMTTRAFTLNLKHQNTSWIKINPSHSAFYRVQYESSDLEKLSEPISSLTLKPSDRLGIQSDAFALSKAGIINATNYLKILSYYPKENDASVWSDIASNIEYFSNLLENSSLYPKFKTFINNIVSPSATLIGWDPKPDETHLDSLLRSILLNLLGKFADPSTLKESQRRFENYFENPTNLNPDIRLMVFSNVARTGVEKYYDQMWDAHNSAELHEEKVRLLMGMTRYSNPEIINDLLKKTLSNQIRSQDTISVISGIMSNNLGRELGWDFIKSNWEEIDRRYGDGGFGIMRLIGNLSGFRTLEKSQEIQEFFAENPAPGAERTIRQSLESIAINNAWLNKNKSELESWFD